MSWRKPRPMPPFNAILRWRGSRLRGKPCQFFGSDLEIQAAENSSRYPDANGGFCSGLDPALEDPPPIPHDLRGAEPEHRRRRPHRQGAAIRRRPRSSAMSCSSRPLIGHRAVRARGRMERPRPEGRRHPAPSPRNRPRNSARRKPTKASPSRTIRSRQR